MFKAIKLEIKIKELEQEIYLLKSEMKDIHALLIDMKKEQEPKYFK